MCIRDSLLSWLILLYSSSLALASLVIIVSCRLLLFPLRASGLDFSSLRRLLPPLVFIFSCLICSCLVSSCLVLSCPVSSCLASSGLFVSCSLWSCPDGHVSSCPSFLVLPPLRLFLSCPVILLALVLSPHVLPPLVSSGLVHSGLVPAVSGSLLACCGGLLEASSEPLGGPLGASGRPPGADFGPLDGPCSPWAAPGPVPGRLLSSPRRPGRPPRPLLALGAALGRSWWLLGGPLGPFGAS